MRTTMKRASALAAISLLATAAFPFHARDASACAILPIDAARPPHLATERVVLIYDEAQKVEHFVREVRFDDAAGAFAFVVPTPSKPVLAEVKDTPWETLAARFPLERSPEEPPEQSGVRSAKSAEMAAPAGVEVLSTQRVGKFTAFILAASDAAALDQWLKENRITLPAGGRPWLDHYVGLDFFFTAFRFEAPGAERGGFATAPDAPPSAPPAPPMARDNDESAPGYDPAMKSETVRLSFQTAVPFYPYLEPARDARADAAPRSMDVWLISGSERRPRVRRMTRESAPHWAYPWQPYLAYERSMLDVAVVLGDLSSLLGQSEPVHVQTFRDLRNNRDGWGDILFPPSGASIEEPAFVATATSMLGDLNQSLHVGVTEPYEGSMDELYRVSPRASGCACDMQGDDRGGEPWIALAGLTALVAGGRAARRRRR